MRVNSINTGHYRKRGMESSSAGVSNCVAERSKIKQNYNEEINTTIKRNSDGRVSFKGGTPYLHYIGQFAHYSPLIAEALFAILITCGARPLTIMATAKSEEDKEKCSYQAAKSISSGLIGLGMTVLIATPIAAAAKKAMGKGAFVQPQELKEKSTKVVKEGIDALSKLANNFAKEGKNSKAIEQINNFIHEDKLNLSMIANGSNKAIKNIQTQLSEKYPDISDKVVNAIKQQKVLNNYERTGKNVIDKLFQPFFMPLRAQITVAMVPVLLGLVGKKKPHNNNKQVNSDNIKNNIFKDLKYQVLQTSDDQRVFQAFSGVGNHESK